MTFIITLNGSTSSRKIIDVFKKYSRQLINLKLSADETFDNFSTSSEKDTLLFLIQNEPNEGNSEMISQHLLSSQNTSRVITIKKILV